MAPQVFCECCYARTCQDRPSLNKHQAQDRLTLKYREGLVILSKVILLYIICLLGRAGRESESADKPVGKCTAAEQHHCNYQIQQTSFRYGFCSCDHLH